MNYISAIEAGEKWKITPRRVAILCAEGRIAGAEKIGYTWLLPKDAEKPIDLRLRNIPTIKVMKVMPAEYIEIELVISKDKGVGH